MKINDNIPKVYFGDLFSKAILILFVIILFLAKQWILAVVMLLALVASFLFSHFLFKKYEKDIHQYLDNAATHAGISESVSGFPFPAVSVNLSGKIVWYNSTMDKLMNGELLFQRDIREFIKDFDIKTIDNSEDMPTTRTEINGEFYSVHSYIVPSKANDDLLVLIYFINVNEQAIIEKKYEDTRFVSMTVAFDNYDEVMQGLGDEERNAILSSLEKSIQSMVSEHSCVLKKTEKDRYSIYLTNNALEQLIIKKFPVLDAARDIQTGNSIAPTLSIGIGIDGETFIETDMFSRAALDMALGRGGDQVVIKDRNQIQFFGGKTREVEKRTKVKARVIAYALRELLSQCDNVLITGHKNADIDCIGAAMGIVSIARMLGKKAFIVQNEFDNTARSVVKNATLDPSYKDVFIKRSSVDDLLSSKTLLIIVDTNSPSYMENSDLLGLTAQVVLFDHHRRSTDFIGNPTLSYHEPYASSTCEMVTEMLPYLSDKNILTRVEAEALYAGICLDTKYFTFKTGVRTLEAAAYLRRAGVDPITVKHYFKTDLDSFTMRASLIQGAKIIKQNIAISVAEDVPTPSVIAQAADELLNISDVDTSFVIAFYDGMSIISGRSTGSMNVQLILEKLGGGGHFSVAGAQLKGIAPKDAELKLIEAIEEYLSEH